MLPQDCKWRDELKEQNILEILSIAMINYFTSAPELFKPSQQMFLQAKNLLTLVQLNFAYAVEMLVQKAPIQVQDAGVDKLLQKLKSKISKREKQHPFGLRQTNDIVTQNLREMSKKQPSQNKGHQNISAQRLIEMRKQGVYKQQSLPVQACLKPLFATVQNVINKMDVVQVAQARDSIIKSSEKIEDLKLSAKQ